MGELEALKKQSEKLFEEYQREYQGILTDIKGLKKDITTQITELFNNQDITTTDKEKIIKKIQNEIFEALDKNYMDLNSHSKNLHKIEEAQKFLDKLREIAINIDDDNLDKIIGGNSIKTIQNKLGNDPEKIPIKTNGGKEKIIEEIYRSITKKLGTTNGVTKEKVEIVLKKLGIQRPSEFKYGDNEIPYNQGKNKIKIWIDDDKMTSLVRDYYNNQNSQEDKARKEEIGDKLKEIIDIMKDTGITVLGNYKKVFQNNKDYNTIVKFAKYIYLHNIERIEKRKTKIFYWKDKQNNKEHFTIKNLNYPKKCLYLTDGEEIVLKEIQKQGK